MRQQLLKSKSSILAFFLLCITPCTIIANDNTLVDMVCSSEAVFIGKARLFKQTASTSESTFYIATIDEVSSVGIEVPLKSFDVLYIRDNQTTEDVEWVQDMLSTEYIFFLSHGYRHRALEKSAKQLRLPSNSQIWEPNAFYNVKRSKEVRQILATHPLCVWLASPLSSSAEPPEVCFAVRNGTQAPVSAALPACGTEGCPSSAYSFSITAYNVLTSQRVAAAPLTKDCDCATTVILPAKVLKATINISRLIEIKRDRVYQIGYRSDAFGQSNVLGFETIDPPLNSQSLDDANKEQAL